MKIFAFIGPLGLACLVLTLLQPSLHAAPSVVSREQTEPSSGQDPSPSQDLPQDLTMDKEVDINTGLGVEDDAFQAGGSCAALAYMTQRSLEAIIRAGYSDDLHSFCFPEEPSECSDYSGLLQGMGRLTTGEDGYHCDLQTQK